MTLIPVQVTFKGLPHSDALDMVIRERVAWLERHSPTIIGCRVVVERPHRHRSDSHFRVLIEVTVAGTEPLVVIHEPSTHGPQRDANEAAHDAFEAARRRLQDFASERRGEVKTHTPQ